MTDVSAEDRDRRGTGLTAEQRAIVCQIARKCAGPAGSRPPGPHAPTHQNGGSDEINVAGLSGELADAQPLEVQEEGVAVGTRSAVNFIGSSVTATDDPGNDRVNVTIVAGAPTAHAPTHQNGGSDEINVSGLSGLLADPQTPLAHATTHEPGGSDSMAVDAAPSVGSLRTLGTGPNQAAAGDDPRFLDSRPPTGPAGGDLGGSYPDPTVLQASLSFKLTGVLAVTLVADQNDYNPAGLANVTVLRVTSSGSIRTITGISGGVDGRVLIVHNPETISVRLSPDDTASAAANRFRFPIGVPQLLIERGEAVVLRYDGALSNWHAMTKLVPAPHANSHTGGGTDLLMGYVGCDSINNGIPGVVPAASAGQQAFLLKGNANWEGLSGVLDRLAAGEVHGTVLFRNATAWVFLAPGTAGQVLTTQGVGADPSWATASGAGRLVSFQVFTTPGNFTWTRPAGVASALVEEWGAGGGGGGVTASATTAAGGGGGGGGGYARRWYAAAAASYAGTVGTGGAGGAAGTNNGTDGTATTFDNAGSIVSAGGGQGGTGHAGTTAVAIVVGGNGAANSSGGDVNGSGTAGGNGFVLSLTVAASGFGAPGFHGGGGAEPRVRNGLGAGSNPGIAGTNWGAGGGGACDTGGTLSRAGGAGSGGIVIVWEFA